MPDVDPVMSELTREATIGGPRFGRLLDSQNGSRKVKHFEGFCKKLFLNVIEK